MPRTGRSHRREQPDGPSTRWATISDHTSASQNASDRDEQRETDPFRIGVTRHWTVTRVVTSSDPRRPARSRGSSSCVASAVRYGERHRTCPRRTRRATRDHDAWRRAPTAGTRRARRARAALRRRNTLRTSATTMIDDADDDADRPLVDRQLGRVEHALERSERRREEDRQQRQAGRLEQRRVLQQLAAEDRPLLVGGLEREEHVEQRERHEPHRVGDRLVVRRSSAQTMSGRVTAAKTRPTKASHRNSGRGRIWASFGRGASSMRPARGLL